MGITSDKRRRALRAADRARRREEAQLSAAERLARAQQLIELCALLGKTPATAARRDDSDFLLALLARLRVAPRA